ncbi:membrane lipoprotein lipid attachment site-containing protein [Vibrio diabolicus]|uniref:membrane lipoprotein lipid attachment site-containing protein n=1 Tax=Vibrio diabolicus TaxID=50719 RepID=UPI00293FAEF0|nr:membrane lipoprotein lipid attachment site-containing protein [Vibrio diabolicus]MDV5059136.1 membrane lipoprotein lipid attachment site-containing protein [Vibrio diabolicus]
MKKIIFTALIVTLLSGCVTRKVRVLPQAINITPITDIAVKNLNCRMVDSYTIEDVHPNNVDRILKNQTYASGGNRYHIATVLDTSRGRPSSVVAELYDCQVAKISLEAEKVKLLPGANEVQPISFAEVENNECKVIGNKVVSESQKGSLFDELSNQVYMAGGNRYHVTNIIDSEGQDPTSVSADIYRCKHRSVAFN